MNMNITFVLFVRLSSFTGVHVQCSAVKSKTAAVQQLGLFCSGDVGVIGRVVYIIMQGVGFGVLLRGLHVQFCHYCI